MDLNSISQETIQRYLESIIDPSVINQELLKNIPKTNSSNIFMSLIYQGNITKEGIRYCPLFSKKCKEKVSNVILHIVKPLSTLQLNHYIQEKLHRIVYILEASPLFGLIDGNKKKILKHNDIFTMTGTEDIYIFNMSKTKYGVILIFDEPWGTFH